MSDKNTPSATAIPVSTVPSGAANTSVPMHLQPKQGAKCCGSCCDYRRAVIIIAIIFLVLNIIGILGVIASRSVLSADIGIDDDEALDTWNDAVRIQAIFNAIGILSAICALCGAKNFNIPLVAIDVVITLVVWVASLIIQLQANKDVNEVTDEDIAVNIPNIVVGFIITCLFIYPSVGFIYEVNSGIMSAETYPREEYSCCCVDKKN